MATADLTRAVVGHPHVTHALARAIDDGRVTHAYLIHGPAMVGKSTLASAFARALLCESDVRPCGLCRSCVDCERGAHPDLRIVPTPGTDVGTRKRTQAAVTSSIGIDQIRELRIDSVLAPARSRWRVYVVLDADHLTTEAMNALLKTLEEPPPHVVLLLTAERLESLLPTIVSRCQIVRLSALGRSEQSSALEQRWHVDPIRAHQLACISRGRIGWSIRSLTDPTVSDARLDSLDRLRSLLRDGTIGRLNTASRLAERYSKAHEEVLDVLEMWLEWWRDAMLLRIGCSEMVANVDREVELAEAARRLAIRDLRAAVDAIQTAADNLALNVNPRLAFEHLVLSLPDVGFA